MQSLLVKAEKLNRDSRARIEHQIPSDDRARPMRPPDHPIKSREYQRVRENLIKLRRMQRNAQRNVGKIMGFEASESNSPRPVAFGSPAAAGRKTPQAPDGLADGDTRRKYIAGFESRQPVTPHV